MCVHCLSKGDYNMGIYISSVYLCVYLYMYVCGGTRVCRHVCTCMYMVCVCVQGYVCVSSYVWLRVAVFQIRFVRSGPLQETRTRFRIVPVMDLIH